MKKLTIFLISCLVFSFTALAQSHVKWDSSVKMTSKNRGELVITATIADGFHMYGMELPQGGPVATSFDFSKSVGVKFVGKPQPSLAPEQVHDSMFELDLNWWKQKVTFTQKFSVTNSSDATIDCVVRYMVCNNESCMPPRKEHFVLKPCSK